MRRMGLQLGIVLILLLSPLSRADVVNPLTTYAFSGTTGGFAQSGTAAFGYDVTTQQLVITITSTSPWGSADSLGSLLSEVDFQLSHVSVTFSNTNMSNVGSASGAVAYVGPTALDPTALDTSVHDISGVQDLSGSWGGDAVSHTFMSQTFNQGVASSGIDIGHTFTGGMTDGGQGEILGTGVMSPPPTAPGYPNPSVENKDGFNSKNPFTFESVTIMENVSGAVTSADLGSSILVQYGTGSGEGDLIGTNNPVGGPTLPLPSAAWGGLALIGLVALHRKFAAKYA